MKVLVLSLLRLGDFFQQVPLLQETEKEVTELHILVNDSLRSVAPLFPQWTFHFFPREILQKNLSHPSCNVLGSFQALEEWAKNLNAEGFTGIENWTHNFLSARLMDLLQAPIQKGARFQQGDLIRTESALVYLNETWGPANSTSFHWVDALAQAMDHDLPLLDSAARGRTGPILLQIFTSDSKKNWDLKNWKGLADQLRSEGEKVRLLCAPQEVESLRQSVFGDDPDILVLDLLSLKAELKNSKLVVSGDTSILHFAALEKTPILGLFLGSANPRKTAPRLDGARILWPVAGCNPCKHRDPCSRSEQVCAQPLKSEIVFKEVISMIRNETPNSYFGIRRLEIQSGVRGAAVTAETGRRSISFWAQVVWDFYLNRDHDIFVAPYATASRTVLQEWGTNAATGEWVWMMQERLQLSSDLLGEVSEALWSLMKNFGVETEQTPAQELKLRAAVEHLQDLWGETDFLTRLFQATVHPDTDAFVRLRMRKQALQEAHELFTVQKNVLQCLERDLKEHGGHHGART